MMMATFSENLLRALIVAPALSFGGAALAAPQPANPPDSPSVRENIDIFAVSLPHAIAAIEAKTGGKVMNIHFDDAGGKPLYDAIVVTPNDVGVARIDALTGEVLVTGSRGLSHRGLSREERFGLESFALTTTPLSAAITTAEQLAGTPAIDAGVATPRTTSNDVLAYNIDVLKDGRVEGIAVDATTGQVIADPGALGLSDRDPADLFGAGMR